MLQSGEQEGYTEFRLETDKGARGSALAIQVQTYSQPPPGSITNGWIRLPSKWSESSLLPLLLSPIL
jgi:hypothetical protein